MGRQISEQILTILDNGEAQKYLCKSYSACARGRAHFCWGGESGSYRRVEVPTNFKGSLALLGPTLTDSHKVCDQELVPYPL